MGLIAKFRQPSTFRWLALFHQTVNEYVVGKKAEEAKQRADAIGIIV